MNEASGTERVKPNIPAETTPPTSKPAQVPPPSDAGVGALKPLSADEQMALYEQDLKETDWGHQPC